MSTTVKSASSGQIYGLYQRFYWDQGDVQFGGHPNFKIPTKSSFYGVSRPGLRLSSKLKGGKININLERFKENNDKGPDSSTYFVLGRSELDNSKQSFGRDNRVLPCEKVALKSMKM